MRHFHYTSIFNWFFFYLLTLWVNIHNLHPIFGQMCLLDANNEDHLEAIVKGKRSIWVQTMTPFVAGRRMVWKLESFARNHPWHVKGGQLLCPTCFLVLYLQGKPAHWFVCTYIVHSKEKEIRRWLPSAYCKPSEAPTRSAFLNHYSGTVQ